MASTRRRVVAPARHVTTHRPILAALLGACSPVASGFYTPPDAALADGASDAAIRPTDAPAENDKPTVDDAPALPDVAVAADAPALPDVAVAADAPARSDAVVAADAPALPDVPVAIGVPVARDVPVATDVPVAIDVPVARDVPVVIDVPVVRDVPAVMDVPMTMDVPVARDVPVAVDTPPMCLALQARCSSDTQCCSGMACQPSPTPPSVAMAAGCPVGTASTAAGIRRA
jgi:hypothetical protein